MTSSNRIIRALTAGMAIAALSAGLASAASAADAPPVLAKQKPSGTARGTAPMPAHPGSKPLPSDVRAPARTRALGAGIKRAAIGNYAQVWTDAVLDCFPPGGGVVGGGAGNNSVSLSINWRSYDGRSYTVRHYVWFEEYWDGGSVATWRTPDNGLAATTPAYGPFHMGPSGTAEFQTTYRDPFSGGLSVITSPWRRDVRYPLSRRVLVRAMVGLQYLTASGWSAIQWWPASTRGGALGYPTGMCAL